MKKVLKTKITTEKILNAAMQEFGSFGYDGASINQICQKYNISKGLIYHNFKNKDDLYLRCLKKAVNEYIAHMGCKKYESNFQLFMSERNRFFVENPYYCHLIFEIILSNDDDFLNKVKPIKRRFDSFNRNIYSQAIDTLKLRKGVSKQEALEYYTVLQNMFNNYYSSNALQNTSYSSEIESHEMMLKKFLNFILFGIAEEEK